MKTLVFFLLFLIPATLFAQKPDSELIRGRLNQLGTLTPGSRVSGFTSVEYPRLIGSPYLNEDWSPGCLYFGAKDTLCDIEMRYNIVSQEVEIKDDQSVRVATNYDLRGFSLNTATFISLKRYATDQNSGFGQLLLDDKLSLVKIHSASIKLPDYHPSMAVGTKDTHIIRKQEYYLLNEQLMEFKSKNLGKLKKKVRSYAREHNLDWKKDSDLIQLSRFYNDLLK